MYLYSIDLVNCEADEIYLQVFSYDVIKFIKCE
jgi:hypothetical protein